MSKGWGSAPTPTPAPGPTPLRGVREHAEGMSDITTYLISASLILLVLRQVREHPLDARSLAVPVLAVGAAAVMLLHSVPAGGSDLVLEAAGVAAGAVMGAIGGLATRLRLDAAGRPPGRAGVGADVAGERKVTVKSAAGAGPGWAGQIPARDTGNGRVFKCRGFSLAAVWDQRPCLA